MKPDAVLRTGLWLCLLIPLFAVGTVRGEVTLRGTVRDSSQNVLPGAVVTLMGSGVRVLTDERGEFSLTVPALTSDRLRLNKVGYHEREVTLPAAGERIDATLAPSQNDVGLIRHRTRLSISHSLTYLQKTAPILLQAKLTDEVYRDLVNRHGEQPAEDVVFRVYLPAGVRKVAGVFLISEHGVGGPMMEHRLFREFADRHRLALVGVLGDPIQRGIFPASTLDHILAEIGTKLSHPELHDAPAFAFGHSNGTGFSALYAALRPDRVIAWISFHSGGSWHLVFPGIEQVPGLVMHGQKDKSFDNGQEQAVADLRRERHAPISLLVDGEAPHWPRNREATFQFIQAFCESCLRLRPLDRPLAPVSLATGWLADRYDRTRGGMQKLNIAPYAEFSGDRKVANWLPDESFARTWQRYAATGSPVGEVP